MADAEAGLEQERLRFLDLLASLAPTGQAEAEEPDIVRFHPAPAFLRALDAQALLVVGRRGVGKTALFKLLKAGHIAELLALTRAPKRSSVIAVDLTSWPEDRRDWPMAQLRTLWWQQLAQQLLGHPIFEAVSMLHPVVAKAAHWRPTDTADTLPFLRALEELDKTLKASDQWLFIAYDDLDRWGNTLDEALPAIGALLQLWIDSFRRFARIRPKIFLRADLYDAQLPHFPDASKLYTGLKIELVWSAEDLYAMWLRRLFNHPDWDGLEEVRRHLPEPLWQEQPPFGRAPIEPAVRAKALVEWLVGRFFGPSPAQGHTWERIPEELVDAQEKLSPRSFLKLFTYAAQRATLRSWRPGERWLAPADLLESMPKVSSDRLEELAEDDPWLKALPPAFDGLRVPADLRTFANRLSLVQWSSAHPPPHAKPLELMEHLVRRGVVFERARRPDEEREYNVTNLMLHALGLRRRSGAIAEDQPLATSAEAKTERTAPATVIEQVERLFCGPRALHGSYTLPPQEAGEVLIPGSLYRFRLLDDDLQPLGLQIYLGLEGLGGALWSRAVRALLQLSARRHPALPVVLGGAYIERENLAYVVTEAARYTLAEPGAMGHMAQDRVRALNQLIQLAHGLTLLQEQGISHLNLHPGAIEYLERDGAAEAPSFRLRLARFEMSSMISNLVRYQLEREQVSLETTRAIYRRQEELAWHPPERMDWLFEKKDEYAESDRSDVYALGVLAWTWLVGQGKDPAAGLPMAYASLETIQHRLGERLSDFNTRTPRPLRDLLRRMLHRDPAERPAMAEVLQTLTENFGRWAPALGPTRSPQTWLVAFMPEEFVTTVYRWGWLQQEPTTEVGLAALRELLEEELGSAEVLHAPGGFSRYMTAANAQDRRNLERACYVLVGQRAYWFCDLFRDPGPAFRRGEEREDDRLLLIKHPIQRERAWQLNDVELRRRIPGELRLLPYNRDKGPPEPSAITSVASWTPLLHSIAREETTPSWRVDLEQALTFLLEFRRLQLEARSFPYVVKETSGFTKTLQVDAKRDEQRQYASAQKRLYFRDFRLPMGSLFEALDGEDAGMLAVRSGDTQTRVAFVERLDDHTIRVRQIPGRPALPDEGDIRPAEDAGDRYQLDRQEKATRTLLQSPGLLHQLHDPTTIPSIRARWSHVAKNLKGRGREIVQDLLTHRPFYALHGPPGSGKTTVTAHAIAAQLAADPSQRILISSQSHHALDNLGVRVLNQTKGQDIVALRVASDRALDGDKVDPAMARHTVEAQTRRTVEDIERACEKALKQGRLPNGRELDKPLGAERATTEARDDERSHEVRSEPPTLRALLIDWKTRARNCEAEIAHRLRRGANLVFATTNACTAEATRPLAGAFDWAIVEEAARAWPTELALPLVQALRWTLIGDHLQLPAFDELAVERFLEACSNDLDPQLNALGGRAEEFDRVFRLFGSLFDQRAERRKARPKRTRLSEPLAELDLQFRMHPDIGRLVSRTFYRRRIDPDTGDTVETDEGWLKSDESTQRDHGLTEPRFLKGRALVWLDTEDVPDTDDQRAWKNEGEARIIRSLLERMQPAPTGEEGFALLTPYRAQIETLQGSGLPDWALRHLHTVDSFQGREADVVVVSLVRSVQRTVDQRRRQRPEANIGYLVAPERVNVLLSRARKLLVIVGRLQHFARQLRYFPERDDLAFWQRLIDEVERQEAVVSARDLGLGGER